MWPEKESERFGGWLKGEVREAVLRKDLQRQNTGKKGSAIKTLSKQFLKFLLIFLFTAVTFHTRNHNGEKQFQTAFNTEEAQQQQHMPKGAVLFCSITDKTHS